MDLIAQPEEILCQVKSILAGDAGNESSFHEKVGFGWNRLDSVGWKESHPASIRPTPPPEIRKV
jgi:hypothetical protein